MLEFWHQESIIEFLKSKKFLNPSTESNHCSITAQFEFAELKAI